jgi:hypothetical protein
LRHYIKRRRTAKGFLAKILKLTGDFNDFAAPQYAGISIFPRIRAACCFWRGYLSVNIVQKFYQDFTGRYPKRAAA